MFAKRISMFVKLNVGILLKTFNVYFCKSSKPLLHMDFHRCVDCFLSYLSGHSSLRTGYLKSNVCTLNNQINTINLQNSPVLRLLYCQTAWYLCLQVSRILIPNFKSGKDANSPNLVRFC